MTTHDREQIITAAKDAGLVSLDYSYYRADEKEWKEISDFYAIAHEAGCQAEREECEWLSRQMCLYSGVDIAESIRARGDTK